MFLCKYLRILIENWSKKTALSSSCYNYADIHVSFHDVWWLIMLLATDGPLYYFCWKRKKWALRSSFPQTTGFCWSPRGTKVSFCPCVRRPPAMLLWPCAWYSYCIMHGPGWDCRSQVSFKVRSSSVIWERKTSVKIPGPLIGGKLLPQQSQWLSQWPLLSSVIYSSINMCHIWRTWAHK